MTVSPLGELILDPADELKFHGPFDDHVNTYFIVRNSSFKRIAFKIKTTATKRYWVKPTSGLLDSDQKIIINGRPSPPKSLQFNHPSLQFNNPLHPLIFLPIQNFFQFFSNRSSTTLTRKTSINSWCSILF